MNKEPIGLYIFRFIVGLGLFLFMMMLYFSSELIEEQLRQMRKDLAQIKNDIFTTRLEVQKNREELLSQLLYDQENQQELLQDALFNGAREHLTFGKAEIRAVSTSESIQKASHLKRPLIDPSLPNLLSADPFYSKTLPEMLGKDFVPHGTLRSATIGKPHNLHPLSNWSLVSSLQRLCSLTLAGSHFGKSQTMAPLLAVKIEERPTETPHIPEFWVHLRDDVYWQPLDPDLFPEDLTLSPHFLRKHRVTAQDVKFYFDAVMNPAVQEAGAASLRNYLGDIESIQVLDDVTLVVRWKSQHISDDEEKIKYIAKLWTGQLRPLPRFVFQYFPDGEKIVEDDSDPETYRTDSVWAQNFSDHWAKNVIISCGPWVFDGMTDKYVRMRRNPDHFNPLDALVQEKVIYFRESPDAIWQDFKANKIDSYELRPDQLVELDSFLQSEEYLKQEQSKLKIQRLDYIARSYAYVGWNQASPFFASRNVRQAMTMAIDRERIIEQNLNRMGVEITGPFFVYSPSYDNSITPWPYDPQKAIRLLEEEGWYDSDGDGIRDKEWEGKRIPFRFSLTYYVKNPSTKANSEYIATALKEIGIDCDLNGVDIADLSSLWDEKDFDAIYLGWSLGSPPEEPRQLWHSSGAKEKGSSNAIGFANKQADALIEQLQYTYDLNQRNTLYHAFHDIIHREAPYTFLYTPKSTLVTRETIRNVFIPAERQDLIPGADLAEPSSAVWWIEDTEL